MIEQAIYEVFYHRNRRCRIPLKHVVKAPSAHSALMRGADQLEEKFGEPVIFAVRPLSVE